MKKVTISIKGMHCRSCEELIKDALGEQKGIKSVKVSHEEGSAVVEFDDTKSDEKTIRDIIRKEGYET
ncbi:heavy-metal-associated domain-containing protein [Candidatus Woesearchaeota archaeon]|nr:heavy-metal-associated domain-containing protein [Candidatus Woesearchaeota archaeon]